jgi:DUF4097 and DUF4098 domain-containing protein YvlB
MKFPIPGTVLLLAVASAGCTVTVDSQSQIVRDEKRFSVAGTPDVRVITFDGSIEIESWDKAEVVIEIEKRGPTRETVDALEVTSTQNGNVIELEVKRPRTESLSGIGFHRTASARLIVFVPRRADVRARSGDGSIRISRVDGQVELRTADGSVRASEVTGELRVNTSDGSITVDGAEGKLALDTGDGGVNVSGKFSSVKVHTGDGSIVYRADPGTLMADDWDIETGDGSVAVYLPDNFAAELDAYTGDGSIRSNFAAGSAKAHEGSRRTLRTRLGAGGRQLRIRTGDGSIRLRAS